MATNKTKLPRLKRIRPHDALLTEHLQYTGEVHADTYFELLVFNKAGVEVFTSDSTEILTHIDSTKINWLSVRGLSDVTKIQEICLGLDMPKLWMQDILNTRHIAKTEETETQILTVMDVFSLSETQSLIKEHLTLWMTENIVVSFQETQTLHFLHLQEAILKNKTKVRSQTADYVYNLLISCVVDDYLQILDRQRDLLLDIEESLMEFESNHVQINQVLMFVRKDYLLIRKNVMPLREAYNVLLNSEFVKPTNEIYYRDTHDHLMQVFQLVDGLRESITALVDLYMANNDLRMNQIMSRLTIISTIFIPLTFMAGIWGMNFQNMPELSWNYGYLYAWASMIIVGGLVVIWLKRKKWF